MKGATLVAACLRRLSRTKRKFEITSSRLGVRVRRLECLEGVDLVADHGGVPLLGELLDVTRRPHRCPRRSREASTP